MVKFFTLHFSLFTLRSFAFDGLFLIGNNVFAQLPTDPFAPDWPGWWEDHEFDDPGEGIGGGITCHQDALPGRSNVCWKLHRDSGSRPITDWCWFSGWMADKCFI